MYKMEQRVRVVEEKFLEWLNTVKEEKNDAWLVDLEHIVVRFLRDKQKKYRKIESYNRMLYGQPDEVVDNNKRVTFE